MNAGPAFVYQGADTAGMAQVFFPEGYDAEVTHDPVGAGVHVARPDLHFSVQSVFQDGKILLLWAHARAKRFDDGFRIMYEIGRGRGSAAAGKRWKLKLASAAPRGPSWSARYSAPKRPRPLRQMIPNQVVSGIRQP